MQRFSVLLTLVALVLSFAGTAAATVVPPVTGERLIVALVTELEKGSLDLIDNWHDAFAAARSKDTEALQAARSCVTKRLSAQRSLLRNIAGNARTFITDVRVKENLLRLIAKTGEGLTELDRLSIPLLSALTEGSDAATAIDRFEQAQSDFQFSLKRLVSATMSLVTADL